MFHKDPVVFQVSHQWSGGKIGFTRFLQVALQESHLGESIMGLTFLIGCPSFDQGQFEVFFGQVWPVGAKFQEPSVKIELKIVRAGKVVFSVVKDPPVLVAAGIGLICGWIILGLLRAGGSLH